MERLTEWRGEHAAVVNHHKNYIDRLAAYEDTGLEPEDIENTLANFSSFLCEMTGGMMSKTNYTTNVMVMAANDHFQRICDECREDKHATELLDAEADGRLLVLPCKVGEIVWLLDERFVGRGRERWPMVRCKINEFAMVGESVFAVLDGAESWYSVSRFKALSVRDFGRTVFLTREEAEAALKGEGNG